MSSLTSSLISSRVKSRLRISLFIYELAKKWSDFHSSKLNLKPINLSRARKINRWVNYLRIQRSLSPKFGLSETLNESLSPNEEKRLHFFSWLIFGLSPNLGLVSDRLSERLIQKVKWPVASPVTLVIHDIQYHSMQRQHYVSTLSIPLSALMSVPWQSQSRKSHDSRRPTRYPCGRVYSSANVAKRTRSQAGESIPVQKWNSPQGGQVHYTDAAAGHQMTWKKSLPV